MNIYQQISFKNYLSQNSSYFINNIQVVVNKFSIGVLQSIFRVISEAIIVIVILLFLAINNLQIVVIASSVFIFSMFLYDFFTKKKISNYGKEASLSQRNIFRSVQEALEGFIEIRILGKEKYFYELLKTNSTHNSMVGLKSNNLALIPRYLIELLLIIIIVTVVQFFLSNDQSMISVIPTLSMFAVASIRILPSMNKVISNIAQIRFGRNFIDLLYNDVKCHEINKQVIRLEVDHKIEYFESLELKNCYFSYSKNKQILKNINMNINNGDFIGIIGESGSGKTTLMNLLLGLLQAESGNILLNKKNMNGNYKVLSDFVAYLPQDVFLIDDTIAKNIALGQQENEIDINKIMRCIKQVKLDNFLSELTYGIETRVGQRGMQISGGQKQRLSLARALYYDRSILIMDESTNSLDQDTESEVLEQIYSLKGFKTVIMISHKIESLNFCNKIYQIKNGNILFTKPEENSIKEK